MLGHLSLKKFKLEIMVKMVKMVSNQIYNTYSENHVVVYLFTLQYARAK